MKHQMKLLETPFEKIKTGEKIIELRQYDEKRKLLNLGDTIKFRKLPELKEQIEVKIKALYRYSSFKELIADFSITKFGYSKDYSPEELLKKIKQIYPEEKDVIGIKIELI